MKRMVIVVAFALLSLAVNYSAFAEKADCLKEPKSFDEIGVKYGKGTQEKIYKWFKVWSIEKYPPSYMCKTGEVKFLVGVATGPAIGIGTYNVDITKIPVQDFAERVNGYFRLISIVYSKDDVPFLLTTGGNIDKYNGLSYYSYVLLDALGKQFMDLYLGVNSLVESDICYENKISQSNEVEDKVDKDKDKNRNIKVTYKLEDMNQDSYKDLIFNISEFNCNTKKQTDFTKIYYADFGGFRLETGEQK